MRVAIRVDSASNIGIGHVMRCLVLAERLSELGVSITFCCRKHPGNINAKILQAGFDLCEMSRQATPELQNYASWLGCSEADDAQEFLRCVGKNPDFVIVDHYAIAENWERHVKKNIDKLVVIDDLANRKHCADLLIDQNIWPNQNDRYLPLVPTNTKLLLGTRYALLRPAFEKLKNSSKKNSIIVFFGGTDVSNECEKVIRALCTYEELPFEVLIVAGTAFNYDDQDVESLPKSVKVFGVIDDFAEQLAVSKYAIGACGTSNWERFCLGVNTSLVVVADNQERLANYLSELGVVTYLGRAEFLTYQDYINEFERIIRLWPHIEKNDSIGIEVDGQGVSRIAEEILKLWKKNVN